MICRPAGALLAFFLAISPTSGALAHGGGLDSSGCHRETATGGYHCHRSKDGGNETLKYIGIAAGAALAGILVLWWLDEDQDASNRSLNLHLGPDTRNGRERGGRYYGLSWTVKF